MTETVEQARERIRREVTQEIVDYIDGDAENGPRYGVRISEAEIDEETERRLWTEAETRRIVREALERAASDLEASVLSVDAVVDTAGMYLWDEHRIAGEDVDAALRHLARDYV